MTAKVRVEGVNVVAATRVVAGIKANRFVEAAALAEQLGDRKTADELLLKAQLWNLETQRRPAA